MSKRPEYASAALGLVAGVGLAFLFLVWTVPGFRNPVYQQERYYNSKNHENGEDNPVARPSFWEIYTSPTDTYAQWIMAVLSVVATGASILAIILIRRTLHETKRTADAALNANNISREIGEAQVRAYLSEEKTFFEWEVNLDQKFKASHVWKNSGQSPALNCLSFVDHVIVGFDEEETFIGSFTNLPSSHRVGHSCASGQRVNLEGQFISIIDLNDLADKKKKLILYSAVAYVDVFKNKHLAESCHVAIFPDDGDAEKILFRTYRYHNGYTDVKS
jgi:hypothetical protein